MRRRIKGPPVHPRTQHHVLWAALSDQAPFPQLTHEDVISKRPLWELAAYIRRMTNTQTQANLDATLTAVSHVRDKTSLNIRINSKPPISIIMNDHREANVTGADFGFARPLAHRFLLSEDPGSDEGNIFALMCEKELAEDMIADVCEVF